MPEPREHAGFLACPVDDDGNLVGDEVLFLSDPSFRVGIQLKAALNAKRISKRRTSHPRTGKNIHVGYIVDGKPWHIYEVMHWHGSQYD